MAFFKISEIKLGSQKKAGVIESDGNIFAITNASYNQNYEDSPSTFSLSVVTTDSSLEMKNYLGLDDAGAQVIDGKNHTPFSEKNIENIKVVHNQADLFTFSGYLSSYSESVSAGVRTYDLTYVDKSIILDKIFVGLTNRHTLVDKATGASVTLRALCHDNTTGENKISDPVTLNFKGVGVGPKLHSDRSYASYNNDVPSAGGMITVGDEQYTEDGCSIPEVDYAISDIIHVINNFNIPIGGKSAKGNKFSLSISAPAYVSSSRLRRQYTGSLRSVLSSWGSDLGFSYVFEDGKITIFDMRSGISVNAIKAAKDKIFSAGVQSMEFTSDASSTESSGLITRFVKPHSLSERTINFDQPSLCLSVGLEDVINFQDREGTFELQRTAKELAVSASLAKVNPDLRTLYYLSRANRIYTGGGAANVDDAKFELEALGVYGVRYETQVMGRARNNFLRAFFEEDYAAVVEETGWSDPICAIVYKSDDMANRFLEWEKGIADNFLGKYFKVTNFATHADTGSCASLYGRRVKIADSNPPFIDSREDGFDDVAFNPYGGYNPQSGSTFYKYIKREDAPFSSLLADRLTDESDLDFKRYVPRFFPIGADALDELEIALDEKGLLSNFNMGGANFQLGVMFFSRAARDFNFTTPAGENDRETTFNEANGLALGTQNTAAEKDCMPNCSVDIAKVICSLDPKTASTQNVPVTNMSPGVTTKMSTRIAISHKGVSSYPRPNRRHDKIAEIMLPVGAINQAGFQRVETINFQNFLSRRGIKLFESTFPEKDHLLKASRINMVENDMSNQVLYSPNDSSGSVILQGNAIVINSAYPNGLKDYGIILPDRSNDSPESRDGLGKFHNDIKNSIVMDATARNDTLTTTVDATVLSSIRGLLDAREGLSAINFSVSDGGSSIKLTFRNLPPKRPDRENFLSGVKTITSHYRN